MLQHFQSPLLFVTLASVLTDLVAGNTLITKLGYSDADCAKACIEEREIDCRYFKHDKSKDVCTLSADQDKTIPNMRKVDKPEIGPIKTPASSWIEQLQARVLALEQRNIDVKNLHKEMAELRAEIAALKNSRALTHHLLRTTKEQTDQNIAAEDEKTEMLKAETKRVEDAIMTLGELQKTFSEKVRKINEAEKQIDLKVAMLSQSSKDTRSSVRELGTQETDLKNGLTSVKKTTAELEVRFAGLSSDVMEKVASIDAMIGPELKEMRESQTTLAEALSTLTKKIMTFAPRIPALQKEINKNDGMFAVVNKRIQSFDGQVEFLNERLRFTERQLRKVIDPASKLNMEQRRMMTYLRGQVASLQDTQKRIESDIMVEITDRTHLYKELASLKISRKAIVDKVVNLEMAVRNFRTTLRKLAIDGPKGRLVTNILNRQVAALRSLKQLRDTQVEIQNAMVKYKMTLLKTHEELMERDRMRVLGEVALKKLQTQLMDIYRKMQQTMSTSISPDDVKNLAQQQKDTLIKMALLQDMQKDLRGQVLNFQKAKIAEAMRQEEQQRQLQKQLRQLQEAKKETVELYSLLNSKLNTMETGSAVSRLGEITKTQDSVVKTLAEYKQNLMRTQEEMAAQRRWQEKEAESTARLHKELMELQNTLQQVTNSKENKESKESNDVKDSLFSEDSYRDRDIN